MFWVEPVSLTERLVGDGRVGCGEVGNGLREAVSFPFGRRGGGGEEVLRSEGREGGKAAVSLSLIEANLGEE